MLFGAAIAELERRGLHHDTETLHLDRPQPGRLRARTWAVFAVDVWPDSFREKR